MDCFNPHPARRLDATMAILGDTTLIQGFNPHPARRLDATCEIILDGTGYFVFQPSPSPKAGCHCQWLAKLHGHVVCVSTLTQPEGRMPLDASMLNLRNHYLRPHLPSGPESRKVIAHSATIRWKHLASDPAWNPGQLAPVVRGMRSA